VFGLLKKNRGRAIALITAGCPLTIPHDVDRYLKQGVLLGRKE
jgi:hypothetical protein